MARRKVPGQSSSIQMLIGSIWVITMLLAAIVGHLIIAIWAWLYVTSHEGIQAIVEYTGVESKYLWGLVAISFLLDIWVMLSSKKDQKKARRR